MARSLLDIPCGLASMSCIISRTGRNGGIYIRRVLKSPFTGKDADFCHPLWRPTHEAYAFDPETGDIITAYKSDAQWHLVRIQKDTLKVSEIKTEFDDFVDRKWAGDGFVYCLAGGPLSSYRVVRIDVNCGKHVNIKMNESTDFSGYISKPEFIEFKTSNDQKSYGYFYPPCNKDACPVEGELPPLLVKAHGGPTGWCGNVLNMNIQYFTSRGFGVLDVNYRGSSGHGRTYRDLLYKNWGLLDVEDCCNGAKHLAELAKVDGERLVIDGASAGGLTTLGALTFHDTFKAGASIYGIGDLNVLNADTHKFESRYCSLLISEDSASPVFKERSPIEHVDQLSCPLVIFQGSDDKVVPPNQAHLMYDAVNRKKMPVALQIFDGEAHGWRKKDTMIKCLEGELYFFLKVFGLQTREHLFQVDIQNM